MGVLDGGNVTSSKGFVIFATTNCQTLKHEEEEGEAEEEETEEEEEEENSF